MFSRYIPFIVALLAVIAVAPFAQAEQEIKHYTGETPTTAAHAWKIITDSEVEIDKLLKGEKVSVGDLESIHKITYSLESAVAYLSEQSNKSEDFKTLAEGVEELHLSSEKHNETKTRDYFARVQSLISKAKEARVP